MLYKSKARVGLQVSKDLENHKRFLVISVKAVIRKCAIT